MYSKPTREIDKNNLIMMEGPQGCFGDTELVVTGLVLYETEAEVRDGPKEIRDGNAPEAELNEC